MSLNINDLIRPNIINLQPYKPILPFEILAQQLDRPAHDIIKLDANENPYGPSPLVAERLAAAPYLHIYPDPECRELRAALADYTGINAEHLLVGLGADELIDLIMRLVINPGDRLINCPPTFGMYAFDAAVNEAEVVDVWRQPDFSLNVEDICERFSLPFEDHPKLIFLTSPNNPDGSVIGDDDLKRILALPTLVVLDEAYIEFSGGSRIGWVPAYPNLIVLRTFSKWAGLAGLRVGYGAFPLAVIEHLWKIKQPYNVPVASQIAALASLEDHAHLLGSVRQLIEQRDQFYAALADISWLEPYSSQTNFILCRVMGRDSAVVQQQLAEAGILVRHYNKPRLNDHLRFSIGTAPQMARLSQSLHDLSH